MTRVLFIGPNLAAGGAERQWSLLAPGLRRRGFDARVVALDGGGPFVVPLQRAGVPLEVLGMRHQADVGRLWRSPTLRRFAADVLVSRGVSGMYVAEALASWRGAAHVHNEHRQRGLVLSRRREAMTRAMTRRLDLVVAVSEDQHEPWRRRGLADECWRVVPNGVESPHVTESREQIRRELGVPGAAIVAVLVATLRPEKRVGDFVAAAAAAHASEPDIVALIVGDGPERERVQRACAGASGVRLLGHRDDVARILKAADIFVLCSEHEALPVALLEAFAAGLPVVTTPAGGVTEIVHDGVTGVLVAPRAPAALAEKIADLARDAPRRRALGERARTAHRELWHAELMIDRYAELLGAAARTRRAIVRQTKGSGAWPARSAARAGARR